MGLAGDKDNSDDHEEVRSIHSDHSYCQPLQGDLRNDSGFIEPLSQPSCSSERTGDQINTEEGISEEDGYKLAVAIGDNENLNNALERPSLPSVSGEMDSRERERKESQSRVEEWRNTINPILRNLKEHDFDIHEYGSQIIDGMEINESKPFSSIVQGKMSAEVVRYFISSLQLANTNNIEICGAKPGKLSNDTYNIKLLSKDRFHEHLRDYVAPSVEMLGEKLERLQAKSAQQVNQVFSHIL